MADEPSFWKRFAARWRSTMESHKALRFGFLLIIAGLLLSIPGVPGPGLIVAFLGLVVLSAEFLWARRLRNKVQSKAKHVVPKKWRHKLEERK